MESYAKMRVFLQCVDCIYECLYSTNLDLYCRARLTLMNVEVCFEKLKLAFIFLWGMLE